MQAGHRDDEQQERRQELSATPGSSDELRILPEPAPEGGSVDSKALTQGDVLAMIEAYEPGATPPGKHPSRILCSELVEVSWRGMDGCQERIVANLEEIWSSGATLDVDRFLPEGASLSIHRKADLLAGRVLYCQQNLTGYTAGIQFREDCRWSPERFVPDHAVELGTLGKEPEAPQFPHQDGTGEGENSLLAADLWTHRDTTWMVPFSGGPYFLDRLRPLISRGSLMALRGQMLPR